MPTAPQLQALLAGTQCTRCGYASCAAYAQALAEESAAPNLCAPGGARVTADISHALGLPVQAPAHTPPSPVLAHVEESDCIGCTKCLQRCPTGAIVGAPKQIHTVLAELCTGCELCLAVCPVSCITLSAAPPEHPLTQRQPDGSTTLAAQTATKKLVQAHKARRAGASTTSASTRPASLAPAPVTLSSLPPELAALAEAARSQSRAKYTAKGPLKTPTALKPKS